MKVIDLIKENLLSDKDVCSIKLLNIKANVYSNVNNLYSEDIGISASHLRKYRFYIENNHIYGFNLETLKELDIL